MINALSRTARPLLMLCAAVVLVGPVLLVAHPISYVPLIMAVLIVAVSWGYLQVLKRSLTMSVANMSASCQRGKQASLAVSVANSSFLPFPRIQMEFFVTDLFGSYDEVKQLTCALGPRQNDTLDFAVSFAHLGTYSAGINHLIIHDLLGLFSARISDGASRSIVVRPRNITMNSMAAMRVMADETHRMLKAVASDDMDYASVREYRFGDPLKTIHWNLTSRSPNATMYTRLYETYVNPTLAIVIDPYAPAAEHNKYSDSDALMSLFDGMVECAATLALQARQAGIDAEIRYVNKEHNFASIRLGSLGDADQLVLNMLPITPQDAPTAQASATGLMLQNAGNSTAGFGNVALVSSRPDAGLLTTLIRLQMQRRNCLAFMAVPRALETKQREKFLAPLRQLDAAQIAHYAVESTEIETIVVGL